MPKHIPGTDPNIFLNEQRKQSFNEYYKKKLQNVKGQIDCSPPKELPHMKTRGLQKYEAKQRQLQIDRDNANLLKRIEYQFTTAKGLDTYLVQKGPKSMNRLRREEELKRITEENRKLHEAILNVKPVMSNA